MAAPESTPKSAADARSFEQSVEAIEAIVSKIESGELGLEESVAAYERAAALLKGCRAELARTEQRVIELSKTMTEAGKQT